MTVVRFSSLGFAITGHCTADENDEQGRLVCASVSSAAYMTVNTITDVICDSADVSVDDGEMIFKVKNPSEKSLVLLEGFRLHIQQLEEQYKDCIKVYLEVQSC